jgi:hypothetical protein
MQSFLCSPMVAAGRAANTTDTAFHRTYCRLGCRTSGSMTNATWTKALVTKLRTDPVRNVSAFSTKRLDTAVIADHSLRVCILRVGGHVDRSRDGHSTVALYQ